MSSSRKLASEIEKTLKKIQEGSELFDEMVSKFYSCSSAALRDKLEVDLKKEIKKLQRLREQVKGWMASSEVKDKAPLSEHRRLVEAQMERFKAIEREVRNKPTAKGGLRGNANGAPLTKAQKDRLDCVDWISSVVDSLSDFIDDAMDQESSSQGSSGSSDEGSFKSQQIATVKGHLEHLEIAQEMLRRELLDPERLDELKEDINWMVEQISKGEFDGLPGEDFYAPLNLISLEELEKELERPLPVQASQLPPQKALPSAAPVASLSPPLVKPAASISEEPAVARQLQAAPVQSAWVNPRLVAESLISKSKNSMDQTVSSAMEKLSIDPVPSKSLFPRLRSLPRPSPLAFSQQFQSSAASIPEMAPRARSKVPQTPVQIASFPRLPLPGIACGALYERFDIDTLFFIFYHMPKTAAQYFAARELKRQSWRFHKKFLTWFQRFEEPKTITEEYEQGTYIYFDHEGSWCQRKKSDFVFEYRYLEDIELP